MNCTSQLLENFFNKYGWSFEKLNDSCWLSGWSSEEREYPLTVHLSEEIVVFEVRPFMEFNIDCKLFPEFLSKILQLNAMCKLVKLSLSPDGQLILSLHALSIYFSFEHFSYILGILGYYADELMREIYLHQASVGLVSFEMPEFLS